MANIKICFMFATIYSGNMGGNALAYSVLYYFEKAAEKLGVKFSYTLIGTGCNKELTDSIQIGEKNVELHFFPVSYVSLRENLKRIGKGIRQTIAKSDLIVDLGGGDSFTDLYGTEIFKEFIFPKIVAMLLKKKYALFPQTIGPFNKYFVRLSANWIMKRIPFIYPRDKLSYEYLQKNIPNRSFKEYLDMAFVLPFNSVRFDKNRVHVGINISGLLWNCGYNSSNMYNLVLDYPKLMKNVLTEFCGYHDVTVHLISHVISDIFKHEDDYRVAKEIHDLYPNTILSPKFRTPIEAKDYISGMSFFMGSRMHACIAAYSSGVPVVPFSYSRKFTGLFQYSLGYKHLVDLTVDNGKDILNTVIKCFNERFQIAIEIQATNKKVEENHTAFINEICNLVQQL